MGRQRSIRGLDLKIPMIAGLCIVVVLVFSYLGVGFGFDASSAADYIAVIPSFIFIISGLYLVISMKGGMFMFPAFSLLGFGMAFLLNTMHVNNLITVQMMSGLSIQSIMLWTVVISGLFGAVFSAVTAKR